MIAAKPGLGTKMSQTEQQEPDAAPAKPKVRKDWELFWRIIAGLMLLVTAWVVWVVYQIMPRSVVTPLAYSAQIRPVGTQQSGTSTEAPAAPAAAVAPSAPQSAAEAAAADPAPAAAPSGAHQVSADSQAAAQENREAPIKREGLRLATEISTPPTEQRIPKTQEGKPNAATATPGATGAAGKDRP